MKYPNLETIYPELIISLVLLFLTIFLTLKLKKFFKRLKGKEVYKKGYKGEKVAAVYLQKRGFKIQSTNDSKNGIILIDNKSYKIHVSPDIIASKSKEKWLIEVKTGEESNINKANVRRQLREYACLYPNHKIAFFDTEKEKLLRIEFPELSDYKKAKWKYAPALYFSLGLSIGILCSFIFQFLIKS